MTKSFCGIARYLEQSTAHVHSELAVGGEALGATCVLAGKGPLAGVAPHVHGELAVGGEALSTACVLAGEGPLSGVAPNVPCEVA